MNLLKASLSHIIMTVNIRVMIKVKFPKSSFNSMLLLSKNFPFKIKFKGLINKDVWNDQVKSWLR